MTLIFLQIQNDSLVVNTQEMILSATSEDVTSPISIWFWIALLEFVIILVLFYKMRKRKDDLKFGDVPKDKLKVSKTTKIDMNNVMNSISKSKELYKTLSKVCHPDRFINTNKEEASKIIFQEISRYKRNFEKLSELKERAINELEIKIK